MTSLLNMAPQQAILADTGLIVDAKDVKVNTIVAVKAGEVIPIDGIVVEGMCEVDEKSLTGESCPVSKQKDANVWAGTINLNGYITVRTTALAEDCVVAKMAMLVEEAQNNKSKTQRLIDDCTKYYTPVVVLVALSLAVIPAALKLHNLNRWFHLALVVLVSACPCALILSTPVATFCTLTKAAANGVLIKGGDYLEILAQIKTMAFDKTGTITRGEFVVTDFRTISQDVCLNTLLYWVSSIESKSSHPMAAALVDYGQSNSIQPKPENVTEFENFPGEGVYGQIDGKIIFIGNKKIASRAGCETALVEGSDTKGGATVGYIYLGVNLIGIFSLSDTCRSGVVDAIIELKKMSIKTVMLTGDSNAAAIHAQEQLGHAIEVVHAELLPEDKARIIKNLKEKLPTAMIGDGINDAPALATADIGISMGISGSALATETGHVTLMSNDIRKIPQAIKLGRESRRKVIENVILSITTKVAVIALACSGHPLLWAAVLVDVGTCLVVILNSMLLLRGSSTTKSRSATSHAHKHKSGGGCGHHKNVTEQCGTHSESYAHEHKSGGGCGHHKSVTEPCSAHSHSASHAHEHKSGGGCGHHKRVTEPSKTHSASLAHEHKSGGGCGNHKRVAVPCNTHSASHAHEHKSGGSCGNHKSVTESCTLSAPTHEQCCSHEVPHCENSACDPPTCSESDHSISITCHSSDHNDAPESNFEVGEVETGGTGNGLMSRSKGQCSERRIGHRESSLIESDACMSLEKREIGGCCRSFRKECEGKHGCLGAKLGGLSEIIISE
ncbi:cadmium/zinc-transporting ATPase HMA2-like isoform X2 [Macadamia integrifolia]|uniref:cadmium/zinc-transporting ATPase HMA2-like isoform X2 n=2 Tax=Macadamia integrifolia TaxID=60698 RepID=UPI001C4F3EFC|nr:cadmium/zinc-transporting ATPase HMA2-like isoform X2 [Macadamia integrifolia]